MEDFRLEGPACARRSNERPRATLVRDRRLGVRGSNIKGARSKATTPAPPPPVDWLADDAVSCERTSLHTKFPANREINREFRRIRPSTAISASNQRANSKACSQIPYATEQGNFAAITGNFFGITGKFNPG